jgi:hypothetical protein
LDCWGKLDVDGADLIINDVSAVAEPIAEMFGYFDESVCGSGGDGLENLEGFFSELREFNFCGDIVLPFLSLSSANRFKELIFDEGWVASLLMSKDWPLDQDIVSKNEAQINALRDAGIISLHNLGGYTVAQTSVYKVEKVLNDD